MIYILAHTYRNAAWVATRRHLVKEEWCFIDNPERLVGTRAPTVWAIEGWRIRADYFAIEGALLTANAVVTEVKL